MEQVVVFGERVVVGAGGVVQALNERIPDEVVIELLQEAGYTAEELPDVARVLRDGGFLKPSSWAVVVRQELVDAGIAPGEINALVAVFQSAMVRRCGENFARVMVGSEKTDAEVALQILKAKHAPAAPAVKEETGWAPAGEQWREYMQMLAAWLGTVDMALARAVRRISADWEVEATALGVVLGSPKDLALGSILRGPSGIGQMVRLATVRPVMDGSGLELLQDISRVLLGPMDEVGFAAWQHPVPITQAHLIESGILSWARLREELRGRGRKAVEDEGIARDAFCELVGSCAPVKPLLVHLKREHGRALTVQQCIDRIALDSHVWLAEKNVQGGRVVSAFAAVDMPAAAAGGRPQRNNTEGGTAGEAGELKAAMSALAEAHAVLAAVVGSGGGLGGGIRVRRGKGKGKGKGGKGPGHCIRHQFEKEGCSKEGCWHRHDPDQLGRFAEVRDGAGRKACGYFAKLGSCFQANCPFAHIEVEGACPGRYVEYSRKFRTARDSRQGRGYTSNRPEKPGRTGTPAQVSIFPAPRPVKPSAGCTLVGLSTPPAPSELVDQREGEVRGCKRPGKPTGCVALGGHTDTVSPAGFQHPLAPPSLGGDGVSQAVKIEVLNVCGLNNFKGSGVIIDNACTMSILGDNAREYIVEEWEAEPVIVRTANGESLVDRKGAVLTRYGVIEGYIVPESNFSLWAMEEALRFAPGGVYTQSLNDACLAFSDGTVISFERADRLWTLMMEESLGGSQTVTDLQPTVTALAVVGPSVGGDRLHQIQGHSVHDPDCKNCLRGRMRHRPRRRVVGPREDQRGGSIYIDLMGPFEEDLEGNVYDMTVLESKCGWIEVVGLRDKSCASTGAVIDQVLTEMSNSTNQLKTDFSRAHTDQGGEFRGDFSKVLASLNLTHTDTGGYNSCVNPAENAQGRLQQTARAMLAECTGGHAYFRELRGLALRRAAYCINRKQQVNRARSQNLELPSPYARAWGKEFDWGNSNEHVFGAKCVFLTHAHEREKFESRGRLGVWVGRNLNSNQHMVVPITWDPTEQLWMLDKVQSVSTVRVFDDLLPLRTVPLGRVVDWDSFNNFVDRCDPAYQTEVDTPLDKLIEGSAETEYEIKAIIGRANRGRAKRYVVEWSESCGGGVTIEPADGLHADLIREYELKVEAAHKALTTVHAELASGNDDMEKMIEELIVKYWVGGSVSDWKQGVEEEFNTVSRIRFEEVDKEVADRVISEGLGMKLRMILERKKDNRMKGRLVGQGFWEDVTATGAHVDSPVANFASVRTLLFKSGRTGEVIASGDISKAFLMADEYPASAAPRYCYFKMYKGGPTRVWRLKGPLYGSRDSPKLWYESIRKFMLNLGFTQGFNEPCVFVHPATRLIVVLFVDGVITRGLPDDTADFFETLNKTYALRSWGILSPENPLIHLGFTVSEEFKVGKVFRYLDQSGDVDRFSRDNGLDMTGWVSSPMPDKYHILKDQGLLDETDRKWYKSLVGQLGWFAISLRWDIAHAVSRLQQYSANPTRGALCAAVRVATYVLSTADFRLGGEVKYGKDQVSYYTDSDHVGDRGLGTKSHSGFMVVLNNIVVHWSSKKQPKTVASPAHAEIYALSEGVREARWFQWIAKDMNIELAWPIIVKVDNTQAISFANSTCTNSRLKGMIDNREEWVRELKDDDIVQVEYVPSNCNYADILSKCIVGGEFNRLMSMISQGCSKRSQVKERKPMKS